MRHTETAVIMRTTFSHGEGATILPILKFSNQHLDVSICFFKKLLNEAMDLINEIKNISLPGVNK